MVRWVVIFLSICLYGTRGHNELDCSPRAKLPHPTDCSKYYICDASNTPNMFMCPRDLLYNPETKKCDSAEKVTCFGGKEEDESTTVVESAKEEGESTTMAESAKEECESTTISESAKEEDEITTAVASTKEDGKNTTITESAKEEDKSTTEVASTKEEDESIPVVEYADDVHQESGKEANTKNTTEDKETDHHKEFYFLGGSSDKSSSTEEQVKDQNAHQDDIHQNFDSNPKISVKVNLSEISLSDDIGGTVKDSAKIFQNDPTDESLNKDSHNTFNLETLVNTNKPFKPEIAMKEKGSGETDADTTETPNAFSSEDPKLEHHASKSDHEDGTYEVEKREAESKGKMSKTVESGIDSKTEDEHQEDKDEKKGSEVQDVGHNIEKSLSSGNSSEKYLIVNSGGTNVLKLKSFPEPIANWTETQDGDSTNLQIYWKHPTEKDYQGSIYFKYQTDSSSDELEIKNLVLKILQLEEESEVSGGDKKVEEGSKMSSENGTQPRTNVDVVQNAKQKPQGEES